MADALVDRIMDSARSRLPGAIDDNLYFELASVLDEFFRETSIWRERIHVPVVADMLEYEVDSTDLPAQVISLVGFVNKDEIPYHATLPSNNLLRLRYQYEAGDYYAYVVLIPTKRINDAKYPMFPQWVSDKHGDCIADGLTYRLMAMPAKPWSSPQHAMYYGKRYRNAMGMIRMQAGRQNLMGGQNWRFPRFAGQR